MEPDTPQDVDTVISLNDSTDWSLTLPSVEVLFPSHEENTVSVINMLPSLSVMSRIQATDGPTLLPFTSTTQKGTTKLFLDGYCYTKKRTLKTSIDWRCTSRGCKGSIKTAVDDHLTFKSTLHSCQVLSHQEIQLQLSESTIVEDSSTSTTKDLAAASQHPYSRKLYQRRWRKKKTLSGGSESSSVGSD